MLYTNFHYKNQKYLLSLFPSIVTEYKNIKIE